MKKELNFLMSFEKDINENGNQWIDTIWNPLNSEQIKILEDECVGFDCYNSNGGGGGGSTTYTYECELEENKPFLGVKVKEYDDYKEIYGRSSYLTRGRIFYFYL